jgi:hypothetical protein
MFIRSTLSASMAATALIGLTACAGNMAGKSHDMKAMASDQSMLPDTMKVPAGHQVAMATVGKGLITYECRAKKDMTGQFEWAFAGPDARLIDASGKQVGKYYGPPATWEATDGSKITGKQLAISPGGTGNIPLQFVQANPTMGMGAMTGVTYIQRLKTQGGVAPAAECGAANMGAKTTVNYQADYIFWKAV